MNLRSQLTRSINTNSSLQLIINSLCALSPDELRQVQSLISLQLERAGPDAGKERRLAVFYKVLSASLKREGLSCPPLYALRGMPNAALYKKVITAWEHIEWICDKYGIVKPTARAAALNTIYDFARTHLRRRSVRASFKPVVEQLARAEDLIDAQLPDYPPESVRLILLNQSSGVSATKLAR